MTDTTSFDELERAIEELVEEHLGAAPFDLFDAYDQGELEGLHAMIGALAGTPGVATRYLSWIDRGAQVFHELAAVGLGTLGEPGRAQVRLALRASSPREPGRRRRLAELVMAVGASGEDVDVLADVLGPELLELLAQWVPWGEDVDPHLDPVAGFVHRVGGRWAQRILELYEPFAVALDADLGAVTALGYARASEGVARILEALEGAERYGEQDSARLRTRAMWALYHLGDARGAEAVGRYFEVDTKAASAALGRMGSVGVGVASELVGAWSDQPERRFARSDAIRVFVRQDTAQTTAALHALLGEHDPYTRHIAWYALARRADPGILEHLVSVMRGSDPLDRDEAAEALVEHDTQAALDALREARAVAVDEDAVWVLEDAISRHPRTHVQGAPR
ncbi:MAG: HEAT repeat domain-containing protein [Myxococcota bacterium]